MFKKSLIEENPQKKLHKKKIKDIVYKYISSYLDVLRVFFIFFVMSIPLSSLWLMKFIECIAMNRIIKIKMEFFVENFLL